jgi:O-methyltransferase
MGSCSGWGRLPTRRRASRLPILRLRARLGWVGRRAASAAGYRIERAVPRDIASERGRIVRETAAYTLTSPERIAALCTSIDYLVDNEIPGCIVECGVWRGGSAMAAALQLIERGDASRELFLYDTFQGMTEPSAMDRQSGELDAGAWGFLAVGMEEVRANLSRTGYPPERVHCVQGRVEDTLPAMAPRGGIALLRLGTDWYQSTRPELEHLYHRIVPGRVLIIDDYGAWQGARLATEEFFAGRARKPLLVRVDYTARLGVVWP